MKTYFSHIPKVWIVVGSLVIWNIGLTLCPPTQRIVTLDTSKVAKLAARRLLEQSQNSDIKEDTKDVLAARLRESVRRYAKAHRAVVVDVSTVIAGEVEDITETIMKEVGK